MSELRWCKNCQIETFHDKVVYFGSSGNINNIFNRLYLGVFTIGISELLNKKAYICKKCDRETSI